MEAKPTVVAMPQASTGIVPSEAFKEMFKKIGIAEITLGGLSILFEVIALAIWLSSYNVYTKAPGIYCGVWFCITGGLAIASYRQPTKCNLIGGMVVATLSLIGCLGAVYYECLLAFTIPALLGGFHFLIILHVLLAILAIGQTVASIFHLKFAGKAHRGETE